MTLTIVSRLRVVCGVRSSYPCALELSKSPCGGGIVVHNVSNGVVPFDSGSRHGIFLVRWFVEISDLSSDLITGVVASNLPSCSRPEGDKQRTPSPCGMALTMPSLWSCGVVDLIVM